RITQIPRDGARVLLARQPGNLSHAVAQAGQVVGNGGRQPQRVPGLATGGSVRQLHELERRGGQPFDVQCGTVRFSHWNLSYRFRWLGVRRCSPHWRAPLFSVDGQSCNVDKVDIIVDVVYVEIPHYAAHERLEENDRAEHTR